MYFLKRFLTFFFKIQKTWLLTFFCFVAYVSSNNGRGHGRGTLHGFRRLRVNNDDDDNATLPYKHDRPL